MARGKVRTQEEIILEFRKVHGDMYDYDLVEFKGGEKNVVIGCKKHSTFEQKPKIHLTGSGCPKCARENHRTKSAGWHTMKTLDQFIVEASIKFNNKFDYSESVYLGCTTKLLIKCPDHGGFWQEPNVHLRPTCTTACPMCTKHGFSKAKPATLYILRFENLTKVGITGRKVKYRLTKINRDAREILGGNFNVLQEHTFSDGKKCFEAEKSLKEFLSNLYKNPDGVFDGRTECFVGVDDSLLDKAIKEIVLKDE